MPTILRDLQILRWDLLRNLKKHGNPTFVEVVAEVNCVLFSEPSIFPFDGEESFVVLAVSQALCSPSVPAYFEGMFRVVVVLDFLERIANVG